MNWSVFKSKLHMIDPGPTKDILMEWASKGEITIAPFIKNLTGLPYRNQGDYKYKEQDLPALRVKVLFS